MTHSFKSLLLASSLLAVAFLSGGEAFAKGKTKKKKAPRKPAQVAQTLDQALREAIEERKIATENFRQSYTKTSSQLDPFKVMPASKIGHKKRKKSQKTRDRLPAENEKDEFDLDF